MYNNKYNSRTLQQINKICECILIKVFVFRNNRRSVPIYLYYLYIVQKFKNKYKSCCKDDIVKSTVDTSKKNHLLFSTRMCTFHIIKIFLL